MKVSGILGCNRKLIKSRNFIICTLVILLLFYTYTYNVETNENPIQLSGAAKWQNESDINVIYLSTVKTEVENSSANARLQSSNLPKDEIVILRYSKHFGHYEPVETLTGHQCKHLKTSVSTRNIYSSSLFSLPCRTTFDRKYLKESSALVFHSTDLPETELPMEQRDENQLWVYLQQESPVNTKGYPEKYPNIFNWTMTYRRDSDVYHPYAYLAAGTTEDTSLSAILTNKTGLVAWIVSNCDTNSSRELLVLELQKYVTVDIFGRCGKRCPPLSEQECYSYVASTYKFYLSFENSLCTDYITEKFYKALEFHMLPIVYGGDVETGLDYEEIAPMNSYIDANSFDSVKDLANYILHLNKNDAEFLRYFEWKKEYQVLFPHSRWCNLCQKLYEHFFTEVDSPKIKWYKDLWKWWNYKQSFVSLNGKQADMSTAGAYNVREPTCISPSPPPKRFTNFNHGLIDKLKNVLKWAKRKIIKKI